MISLSHIRLNILLLIRLICFDHHSIVVTNFSVFEQTVFGGHRVGGQQARPLSGIKLPFMTVVIEYNIILDIVLQL